MCEIEKARAVDGIIFKGVDETRDIQEVPMTPQKIVVASDSGEFLAAIENEISQIIIYAKLALENLESDNTNETLDVLSYANALCLNVSRKLREARITDSKCDKGFSAILHDLNNIMTAFVSYIDIALMNFQLRNDDELVKLALRNIDKWAETVKSRNGRLKIAETESLQSVVYCALGFSESHRKNAGEVRVILSFPSEMTMMCGASRNWVRVFMNLFNNAYDAFFETSRCVKMGEKILEISAKVSDGALTVQVSDNAHGMSREVERKVFDPYFSTKGANGTGIGLYFCKDFVEKCGGQIEVFSEEGLGTIFTIVVPVIQ